MRIVFANLPKYQDKYIQSEECCWRMWDYPVLPAVLLMCASEAKRNGHDVRYVDLAIEPDADINDCDLIVHPLPVICPGANDMMRKYKPLRVGIVNPPGYADELSVLPGVFAVIYSEPEFVVSFLPQSVRDMQEWRETIRGIAHNGTVSEKAHAQFDIVGETDFSLVPKRYWQSYVSTVVQATRGCQYRCAFCVWGGSLCTDRAPRARDAKVVAKEISTLCKLGKPVYVLASQLTSDKRWCEMLAGNIERGTRFSSNFNLRELDDHVVNTLMSAGMKTWSAGLEALTDETLAMLNKPYNLEGAMRGISVMEHAGLSYNLHLLVGYGETAKQVKAMVSGLDKLWAAGMRNVKINLTQLFAARGTNMYDRLNGLMVPHTKYSGLGMLPDERIPVEEWRKVVRAIVDMGMARRHPVANVHAIGGIL